MAYQTNAQEWPEQVGQVLSIAEALWEEGVLGIYLYGSSVLGGLRPESDLDLLILTDREMPAPVREELTRRMLLVSGRPGGTGRRPLELTVINRNDIVPWHFPPNCEYMYGEWLREEIESGETPAAAS